MPKKKTKVFVGGGEPTEEMLELVKLVQGEVRSRLGPNATFEQQSEAAAELMAEALAFAASQEHAGAGGNKRR